MSGQLGASVLLVAMLGLYGLALAAALGLLALAGLLMTHGLPLGDVVLIWKGAAVLAGVGGGIALYALWPRRTPFAPSGPALERGRHPRFFAELDSIAHTLESPTPDAVHLTADTEACIVQHDDLLGFGGRRTLMLGLPLLAAAPADEVQALLARELALRGAGSRAAARILAVRESFTRASEHLQAVHPLLTGPFRWLGALELAISASFSRACERAADRAAAAAAGSVALEAALAKRPSYADACRVYLERDLAPVLRFGHLPPFADGFRRFVAHPLAADALARAAAGSRRPAGGTASGPAPRTLRSPPAGQGIALLDDVPALEVALLDDVWREGRARKLRPLRWEDLGGLLAAEWRRELTGLEGLRGLRPAQLEQAFPRLEAIGREVDGRLRGEAARLRGARLVGAALAVTAVAAGCRVRCGPGEPAAVERAGVVLDPFAVLARLDTGALPAAEWQGAARALGIAEADLGDACGAAPAGPC